MAFIKKDDPIVINIKLTSKGRELLASGQLNFSCAHCHVANAGMLLRSNRLSVARGHVTHFPVIVLACMDQ